MTNLTLLENIYQIVLAFIGSIGFAMALNAKRSRILAGGIGGAFSWGIYLFCEYISLSIFASSVASASFSYLYSGILSKIQKAPITVFFAPTIIPLLPGGGLYYTIYSLIEENNEHFYLYGKETLHTSLGLVVGFIICSAIWNFFISISKQHIYLKKN